jgi:hypothetical protein
MLLLECFFPAPRVRSPLGDAGPARGDPGRLLLSVRPGSRAAAERPPKLAVVLSSRGASREGRRSLVDGTAKGVSTEAPFVTFSSLEFMLPGRSGPLALMMIDELDVRRNCGCCVCGYGDSGSASASNGVGVGMDSLIPPGLVTTTRRRGDVGMIES